MGGLVSREKWTPAWVWCPGLGIVVGAFEHYSLWFRFSFGSGGLLLGTVEGTVKKRTRGRRISPHSLANLRPWPKGQSGNPNGRRPKLRVDEAVRGVLLERIVAEQVGLRFIDVIRGRADAVFAAARLEKRFRKKEWREYVRDFIRMLSS